MARRLSSVMVAGVLAAVVAMAPQSASPARAAGEYLFNARASGGIARIALDGTYTQGFVPAAGGYFLDVAADASHLYWVDSLGSRIGRSNLDGTGVTASFITTGSTPTGLAVDGGHIYWIHNSGGSYAIGRATLDGVTVENRFIPGTSAMSQGGVAVDGTYIYWTEFASGLGTAIGRANFDGTGADAAWLTGMTEPCRIALDGTYIYWTSYSATGSVSRATLAGTGATALVSSISNPWGIAVDSTNIYWTAGTTAVGRSARDGTGATNTWATGFSDLGRGLAIGGAVTPVAPVVTLDPVDQSVVDGATATFTAAATGTPAPTVQWQVLPVAGSWTDIGGATSTTLAFTAALADDGKQYRAIFSNGVLPDATTAAATLTVTAAPGAPTATGFYPATGPAGTVVTIVGTGFTGASGVTIGGVAVPFTVVSDTCIMATVAAATQTGPIVVTTPQGTASPTGKFVVTTGPVVTGFSPAAGRPGMWVTITGLNFMSISSVTFNGVRSTFSVRSSTQIVAAVPAGASTGTIRVAGACGSSTSRGVFTILR